MEKQKIQNTGDVERVDRQKQTNAALSTVGFSGLGKGKEGFGWAKLYEIATFPCRKDGRVSSEPPGASFSLLLV